MYNQTWPKYPKIILYIFAVSPEKHGLWNWFFSCWFFPADNCQLFLQNDTVIFDACGQTCPNYPKQKVCYFLQYLKKEVNVQADFLHAGNYENLLQIDSKILMDMVKHFQSSQNSKFTMSIEYLKKEVRDEVDFFACRCKK